MGSEWLGSRSIKAELPTNRGELYMGYYGWRSGYVTAQNLQAVEVDVSTDASGNGTAQVSYPEPVRNSDPIVLPVAYGDDGDVFVNARGSTQATVEVAGSSNTGGTVSVLAFVYDRPNRRQ